MAEKTNGGGFPLQGLFTGMKVTIIELFKKPVTVQYPEEKVDIKPRFRGRHHLLRHPDPYLLQQAYLQPHPPELSLRNAI